MHHHGTGSAAGLAVLDGVTAAALVGAAVLLAVAVVRARRRGPWPAHRTALLALGLAGVAAALVGPLADAARTGPSALTAHMAGHLLLGMLGPLLLVRGAPVTLALRALPVGPARRLVRALRSRPVRVLTHPVVAAASATGGLWVLYGTDLLALTHTSPPVAAAVHAHVLVSGCVLTAALVGVDPDPHRAPVLLRAAVLAASLAAHTVLAQRLRTDPPAGVGPADAEAGALLMLYGGEVVDVVLVALVAAGWYRATAPPGVPVRAPAGGTPRPAGPSARPCAGPPPGGPGPRRATPPPRAPRARTAWWPRSRARAS